MQTNHLKAYAPAARHDFIQAVTDRARALGLSESAIEPVNVQGDVAFIAGRPFPAAIAERRQELEAQIAAKGFAQVMEEVAYTWFNRLTALRYMELHDYLGHGYRVLSNPSGSEIPEILEKATSVDLPGLNKDKVTELRLAGDKDAELYRLLLITQCNALHHVMPFLFERVSDASELLLPENLLHTNSPIHKMVAAIPEEDWQHIEIVGWLYQFYISDKKDQVIGKTVKSEDIPAATQLFTPNWIVKYMVQNTLGRKWLMTYPHSSIRETMEFYIQPAEQEPEVQAQLESITPKELDPEELTFMDPACGSGHILAEAYVLFKAIYQERGYRTRDIPRLILEKNLFGLDIDDRAAQLARFTVLMKARADDRRILNPDQPVRLNVHAIQESNSLEHEDMAATLLQERTVTVKPHKEQQGYLFEPENKQAPLSGTEYPDITPDEFHALLRLFQDAKTYGSLLSIPEHLQNALPRFERLLRKARQRGEAAKRFAAQLLPLVRQAQLLGSQYDFVVANPPYMGSKGLNAKLKSFLKDTYTDYKSDLFSAFIVSNLEMSKKHAQLGFMSPYVWMFISSYEKLRNFLLNEKTITSLIQLEYSGFEGATVPICTYTIENSYLPNFKGSYIRLSDFRGANNQAPKTLEAIQNPDCGWYYTASGADFKKIPGSPIAYWLHKKIINNFDSNQLLGDLLPVRGGMTTGDNERFLRFWYEIDYYSFSCYEIDKHRNWYPYNKGGEYRKWSGNKLWVIFWKNNGFLIKNTGKASVRSEDLYFREMVGWTDVTSYSQLGARYYPEGFLFDASGPAIFTNNRLKYNQVLGLLCSKISSIILQALNATLHVQSGNIACIPWLNLNEEKKRYLQNNVQKLVKMTEEDWDAYEISWGFKRIQLLVPKNKKQNLSETYFTVRYFWLESAKEVAHLEEENNRIFIEAYGLQDELTPDVPLEEITLTCNPYYRYGGNKSEEELEALLRADTMKELISYAIGCMMGRYSLDEPGLIYAHSGNEGFDPSRYQTFPADEDGIIPVMDEDWFTDDATSRFVEFIKVAWPPETLDENLKFVADSLGPKKNEEPIETIRRYISDKFFKDHHLKVYKKRPIYWLFSSGKHKAFQCLVYLHRYNESTLSRMRAMYVTPLQGKYKARLEYLDKEAEKAPSSSARKRIEKEQENVRKKQKELQEYDEILRHYADQRISLDLDDGVKVNYGKFGNLLAEVKAVTGKKVGD